MKMYILFYLLLFLSIYTASGFAQQPVRLKESHENVILSNEYVQVTLSKKKANIISLKYKGLEMIGKLHPNWNIVSSNDEGDDRVRNFPQKNVYTVRIDPSKNNWERAEVSFNYIGEDDKDAVALDIDLRFTLGRSDKGVYLSALMRHRSGFPVSKIGQGRMVVELNPEIFDFYTVDKNRQKIMPTSEDVKNGIKRNVKEATLLTTGLCKGEVNHKYDYATILAQTPTWGWTSTQKHVGVWIINPSFEYINGGPTQVGNTGHVEAILLDHWQDGHYGGRSLEFGINENWAKFIGPVFLYCNAGADHTNMWHDAIEEATRQRALWPYSWVVDKEYPQKQERGVLSGQIQINDTYESDLKFSNMWVGLAYPTEYDSESNQEKEINWQYEGKHYQFWVKADNAGNFTIPNIRSGKYSLYAFADGVLGEYNKTGIAIASGDYLNLGKLVWTPVRYGKQLWEIGIPDRSAAEFKHGDHYWQWGLYMLYPSEFPNDVNFTIGKSDWTKDWNYCQPTVIGEDYKVIRGTAWTILFDVPKQTKGTATLRIAICGSRNGEKVQVALNDKIIGNTGPLPKMGVMHRDGIRGKEVEVTIPFDAKLLNKGTNSIKFTLNAKNWTFGVLYDYLRLELDTLK